MAEDGQLVGAVIAPLPKGNLASSALGPACRRNDQSSECEHGNQTKTNAKTRTSPLSPTRFGFEFLPERHRQSPRWFQRLLGAVQRATLEPTREEGKIRSRRMT